MNRLPVSLARACALWCAVSLTGVSALAQEPAPRPPAAPAAQADDLDAFMEKVLARREVNRKTLNQYVLDETESFEVLGPGRWPLHRTKRDFTWYVRDGMHVRSPVRFDGVERRRRGAREYETTGSSASGSGRNARPRRTREGKDKEKERSRARSRSAAERRADRPADAVATEPRFVSEAYFMDFKFEPGNYYLAGREKLEGRTSCGSSTTRRKLFND